MNNVRAQYCLFAVNGSRRETMPIWKADASITGHVELLITCPIDRMDGRDIASVSLRHPQTVRVPDREAEPLRALSAQLENAPPPRYRPRVGAGVNEQCPRAILPLRCERKQT